MMLGCTDVGFALMRVTLLLLSCLLLLFWLHWFAATSLGANAAIVSLRVWTTYAAGDLWSLL